ncbi:carboxymuconolactone decarboxylase family protein [Paucibacter sp. APW11]|uniref:Carboxymuconolactone decarboxylase family protein n=1 Tax=Roseateles aquae TaxID=3077235 RepID=A0ABU3PI36_9BURK|nr:carboxymuconolactone decarboxylase family protein [Paucibacter sp. APW11]MDT9002245.1 carboxymuconolactone decarboxylase family protein [Paucibacter sp. APW11]
MSRLSIPTVEQSHEAAKPLLAAVNKQLGVVPNLMKLVGHSPAALEGYLSLSGALGKGELSAQLRERIALAVAEFNGCDYCLSAHDYIGRNLAKLSGEDIAAARDFHSPDAASAAALRFARRVVETRGQVDAGDVTTLRAAGFSEGAVIEIVLNVALNVLTNYVNNVAQTEVDFPKVSAKKA